MRDLRRAGIAWGLAFALPGGAAEPNAGWEAYQVDVRDVLALQVYGEASLSGSFEVQAGGVIDVPLLRSVEVSGLTPLQVAERLEAMWGSKFLVDPHVTVQVERYASKPVQVLGGVENPGIYYLSRPTTLLDLLAQAGGVGGEGAVREIRVQRGSVPSVVDLERLVSSGEGNLVLQANDIVYVPEGVVVYVAGEVTAPGAIPFVEGLTVSQAMTRAGGWKPTANLRQVYLLRDGQRTPVNFKRVLEGRARDVVLAPGDQLLVEEAVF